MTMRKIGALLRKAGHQPSKRHASRQVRGWGSNTPGYALTEGYGGAIAHLGYNVGSSHRRDDPTTEAKLAEYQALLTAAGYDVRRNGQALVVDPPATQHEGTPR